MSKLSRPRLTAMFYLETYGDGGPHFGAKLDSRVFIGTLPEAIEELQAEVEESYPPEKGVATKMDRRYWERKRQELSYNGGKYSTTVCIWNRLNQIEKAYKMYRYGPFKAEE